MRNVLLEYMNKRAKKEKLEFKHPGPVITISRQYGCFATGLSKKAAQRLSERSPNEWNYITKEILEDAAKKLNVREQEIAHIFGANEKSFLGDLIVSFSKKKYASDSHIKKTIYSVVKKYAEQGHCIIVGRAGCVIAKDISMSIHVRIIAPFDYRVEAVQAKHNLDPDDACDLVIEIDKKRDIFMKFFKGNKPDSEIFDFVINKSKLSDDEIIDVIVKLAELRHFI